MPSDKTFAVEIQVLGTPEPTGLRIRTRNPLGLYLSLSNFAYAIRVFEDQLLDFIFEKEVFPDETYLGPAEKIDWEKMVANQGGSIIFRVFGEHEEVKDFLTEIIEAPDSSHSVTVLVLKTGQEVVVISDSIHHIDPWVIQSIEEDFLGAPPPNTTLN